mgnify:CR=1 FL=1
MFIMNLLPANIRSYFLHDIISFRQLQYVIQITISDHFTLMVNVFIFLVFL